MPQIRLTDQYRKQKKNVGHRLNSGQNLSTCSTSTMILPILPMDVIYYLMQFHPWWMRAAPVSKVWVRHVLDKRTLVRRWKSKRLLFSYMTLFGPMTNWSWEFFAVKVCRLKQRSRNQAWNLSWKAAAVRHMTQKRCQACGVDTVSNVFGTYLCKSCRSSKRKVNAYMLTTGQAKTRTGISKRLLDTIPYYRGVMGARLRFAIDIHRLLLSSQSPQQTTLKE